MPAQATPVYLGITGDDLHKVPFPGEEDVHVWLIPVSVTVYDGLNDAELARAVKFRQPADAGRFSTARIALRRLAGHYLAIPPALIQVGGEPGQKPYLQNKSQRALHFNLSHSGGLVLIGFGGRPLGIDIEAIDPAFDPGDLLPEHFSIAEQRAIAGTSDPLFAFYQLWTRKEAVVKARGTGLHEALHQLPVLLSEIPVSSLAVEHWHLQSITTLPGYAAALACNVSDRRIVFYRAI